MPPKKKRKESSWDVHVSEEEDSDESWEPVPDGAWDVASGSAATREICDLARKTQYEAGEALVDIWLQAYAEGRMSAKELCEYCFYADASGASGPFQKYSLQPTRHAGNCQTKLNREFHLVRQ
eukprot:4999188-Pyramimonas_sp.AAC.1